MVRRRTVSPATCRGGWRVRTRGETAKPPPAADLLGRHGTELNTQLAEPTNCEEREPALVSCACVALLRLTVSRETLRSAGILALRSSGWASSKACQRSNADGQRRCDVRIVDASNRQGSGGFPVADQFWMASGKPREQALRRDDGGPRVVRRAALRRGAGPLHLDTPLTRNRRKSTHAVVSPPGHEAFTGFP